MSALDLVTILCGILALALSAGLVVVCMRLLRAAHDLSAAAAAFEQEAVPAVQELRVATRRAVGEVDRLDDLLEVAGSIGGRVDTATEVTYRALTSPVIRGVAIASGTRRVAQRLRNKEDPRRNARPAVSLHGEETKRR